MANFLKTEQGTFLFWGDGNVILHKPFDDIKPDLFVRVCTTQKFLLGRNGENIGTIFPHDHGYGLQQGEKYYSVRPDNIVVSASADAPAWWETLWMVPEEVANHAAKFNLSIDSEISRFSDRVKELLSNGEPIKLYCGAGTVPKPGFLNIDIEIMASPFAASNPHEYFIFPFVDFGWRISNNTIDYICHEDCLEHLTQLQQIQFLAEAFRVLKPGCYHRVNTPNIIAAMERHSDFERGLEGTYKGELQWGHISLFSPNSLKEIAEMIGYSEVVPSRKSQGLSPYAIPETRPGGDRDEIIGNVIADLRK